MAAILAGCLFCFALFLVVIAANARGLCDDSPCNTSNAPRLLGLSIVGAVGALVILTGLVTKRWAIGILGCVIVIIVTGLLWLSLL